MKPKQPPKAVRLYMADNSETEQEVREYIVRQMQYFKEIPDTADMTVERWLGFKLGCSASAASTAIRWASTDAGQASR